MHPLDFVSKEEYRKFAEIGYYSQMKKDDFRYSEEGSEHRFETIFKKHLGWWLIHNLIAHFLIGVCPIRLFFKFHDYTSIKMRA